MANRQVERERERSEAMTFLRRLPDLLLLTVLIFGVLSLVQWLLG